MEVEQVRVQNFKCIHDSNWVKLEEVTSLIGRNQSGKTAFLEALNKFNPVDSSGDFNHNHEYPRRNVADYRQRHEESPDTVVSVKLRLDNKDVESIEQEFGEDVLIDREVKVRKKYDNDRYWTVHFDEEKIVKNILDDSEIDRDTKEDLSENESLNELKDDIEELEEDYNQIFQRIDDYSEDLSKYTADNILAEKLPKFFYFDEYSMMDGRGNINQLRSQKQSNNLDRSQKTFLSLLSRAGLEPNDLINPTDREVILNKIESAAISITDDVKDYWSQSENLAIKVDDDLNPENNHRILELRVEDNRRGGVTVKFEQSSKGFIWFFSFLSYFSQIDQEEEGDLVLLLDEPGLNLHGKAQGDLLNYMEEELKPEHKVIYTTHSPFMVDPQNIQRTRVVEDQEDGTTNISDSFLKTDKETQFPLQGIFGYSLIQSLFIGPKCLLVEGKSDMIYLNYMSEILEDEGKTSLSREWTIVPTGGADNMPTFVSLFSGNDLEIAILMDDNQSAEQQLDNLTEETELEESAINTISEFISNDEGDIEDLFEAEFYVELINSTYRDKIDGIPDFGSEIEESDLQTNHDRLVERLEEKFRGYDIGKDIATGKFNHKTPAKHLINNKDEFRDSLSQDTKDRFEEVFETLNTIIE